MGFAWCFPHGLTGVIGFGRKTIEVKHCFHHRSTYCNIIYHCYVITWLRECLSGFSMVESLSSPRFPYCLEGNHMHCWHLRSVGCASHPWRLSIYLIWNSSIREQFVYSKFTYSVIYIHRLMMYILYFVLYSNTTLFFFAQIVPALTTGSPFSWLLCPFDMPSSLWSCLFFLFSIF